MKTLLERDDVNPNSPDHYGRTPLLLAAYNGHEGLVEILFGRGDVNPTSQIRTEHHFGGLLGVTTRVVKILLERDDVNLNKIDECSQTPLQKAIEKGHAGVITLLQPLTPAAHSTA